MVNPNPVTNAYPPVSNLAPREMVDNPTSAPHPDPVHPAVISPIDAATSKEAPHNGPIADLQRPVATRRHSTIKSTLLLPPASTLRPRLQRRTTPR